MLFQFFFQRPKLLILLRLYLGRRDLGPKLNDPGQIFHGQSGLGLGLQLDDLCIELNFLAAEHGKTLIILLVVFPAVGKHFDFQ